MDSIGGILRTQREKRGLSVEEAHESTKITVQNISALESDRFDSFPNKVYARAFLRDYANFLALDSGELLTAYEEQWSAKVEPQPVAAVKHRSPWRAFGYTVLVLILLGGLGAGGYLGWTNLQRQRKLGSEPGMAANHVKRPEVATIPKAPPLTPPEPEAPVKPTSATKPPVPPAAPQTQTLEVSAILPVWVRVVNDGKTAFIGTLAKGQTMSFQGKTIIIRAGMAGAVQLKLNGQIQPPLGSLKEAKTKVFTMPVSTPPTNAPSAPPASSSLVH